MTDYQRLVDFFIDEIPEDSPFEGKIKYLVEKLIVEGVTFQKWIPVTERLPDKMMQCVCQYVFGDNREYPFYAVMWYFANDEVHHFQNEGSMGLRVTHWMPLPAAPGEEA